MILFKYQIYQVEFHGTARVSSEIGALQVPWNSMELLVSVNLTHPKFMEFHGTACVSEFDALQVPWNSMEVSFTNFCFIFNICIIPYAFPALLMTYQNIIENLFLMLIETYSYPKVPWNFLQGSMELFEQHLSNTCGSMEFHGILSRSKFPMNSTELFPHFLVPRNF